MKAGIPRGWRIVAALAVAGGCCTVAQAQLGPGVTYQGQLKLDGLPITDTCSFEFSLWDGPGQGEPGMQIGATQYVYDHPMVNGLFTVLLNAGGEFGPDAFNGQPRWLEITVTVGEGTPVTLSPRQSVTPAPYAVYSDGAPWAGLYDVPAGFADGVDDDTTYEAGAGLQLLPMPEGGTFEIDPFYRLPQACVAGQVAKWDDGAGWLCADDEIGLGGYWSLSGNSGTDPLVNFLGTTDDTAIELRVNNATALRLLPDPTSPNLVGGHGDNDITAGVVGAAISGGGDIADINIVTDHYGAVGGGAHNQAGDDDGTLDDATYATVGGGHRNAAMGMMSTVGGGQSNVAGENRATVGGGDDNHVLSQLGTIAGGWENYIWPGADYATIAGGSHNSVQEGAEYATIAGGGPSDAGNPTTTNNVVFDHRGTISGGVGNQAGSDDSDPATAISATVSGGGNNRAIAAQATVGGGYNNEASEENATVSGGVHCIASGRHATVGGGYVCSAGGDSAVVSGGNNNTASGHYATVGGGYGNTAGGGATVGGGDGNTATGSGSTVGGGYYHDASGEQATISGGNSNTVVGDYATAGGGQQNTASGGSATVAGGIGNAATAQYATMGGGAWNNASGEIATVAGGYINTASGARSTVSGGYYNEAQAEYATIAGGGPSDPAGDPTGTNNRVLDNYGTIGGGGFNRAGSDDADPATAIYTTVAGGLSNGATGMHATVGGGEANEASGTDATVSGGSSNVASGSRATVAGGVSNSADSDYTTVGGGGDNTASGGHHATVGGGGGNTASGVYATVGGGYVNTATGTGSTVGGGLNHDASGEQATISGGNNNTVVGDYATVGGGADNTVTGMYATIAGGHGSTALGDGFVGGGYGHTAAGGWSVVTGGRNNQATSDYAIVPGGYLNVAGGEYSFAAGRRANVRDPDAVGGGDTDGDQGTFVWADSTDADFISTGPDQFLIRATGGVGIGTAAPSSPLHVVDTLPSGDRPAVLGEHAVTDYYGVGVRGVGGWRGVDGVVVPTGSLSYTGVRGSAVGGTGTNYGVYGYADGDDTGFDENMYGGYFVTEGDRESAAVLGRNASAYDTEGRLAYVGTDPDFPLAAGVYGKDTTSGYGYAGYFDGDVHVTGDLSASGSKPFKIDHPLDPENKYLYHYALESPEVLNVYRGSVVLDAAGQAWVSLPEYFDNINRDFHYQLTCVGGFAPVYVANEIENNRFKIAGGLAGLKVCWMVTGVRDDAHMRLRGAPVEVEKAEHHRSKYLDPEAWGQPQEKGVHYTHREDVRSRSDDQKKPAETKD